eukprot:273403_1
MYSSVLKIVTLIIVTTNASQAPPKPLVFAHWMPWFQYPQNAYHWPPISGTYYLPIVGYYNSQNETVINWQLSLMEYVGINGIIADWYGLYNQNDYPFIKNTTDIAWRIIQQNFPKMQIGICYDFTSYVNQDKFTNSMNYLKSNYFNKPQYMKYSDGNPIMVVFPSYNTNGQLQTPKGLSAALEQVGLSNLYVYMEFRNPAFKFDENDNNTFENIGVFNWVYPQQKSADKQTQINQVIYDNNYFYSTAGTSYYNSKFYLGSFHHGFSDHYVQPGTGTTNPYNLYGFIDLDYDYMDIIYNQTYYNNSNGNYPYMIQIPTWNDYTEGTMIEPNYPSNGCTKGCNDNTKTNPYNDLVTLYRFFVDSNADPSKVQQDLEAITKKFFPNITL